MLEDVQKLFGKLLHTCLMLPHGRAYLTGLEAMLGIFKDTPFTPCHPPHGTQADLAWWYHIFLLPTPISREIPLLVDPIDVQAFSDTSSSIGIGIVIGSGWRAWRLLPGWQSNWRDIRWAEAIGFELLVQTLSKLGTRAQQIRIYGDNKGVIEGWWKGRSCNPEINAVFRRIHDIAEQTTNTFYTQYVPSKNNPADGPSRGIYPYPQSLLPPVELPTQLQALIVNYDVPLLDNELCIQRISCQLKSCTQESSHFETQQRATADFEFNRYREELHRK
jgi:hypothetical protein